VDVADAMATGSRHVRDALDRERAASADTWRVTQTEFEPRQLERDETLFALSNGNLGVRGSLEEMPSVSRGTFLAGAWERSAIHYHERHPGFARHTNTRVPVADATLISIHLGASELALGELLAFERVLDMRTGRLSRRALWRAPSGHTLEVDAERVVPFADSALLCIRLRVRSIDYSGPIALESALRGDLHAVAQGDDPRIGAGRGSHLRTLERHADAEHAWLLQGAAASRVQVRCTQRHAAQGLQFVSAATDEHGARQVFAATIAPGESITLEKFVAYANSAADTAPDADALAARTAVTLDAALAAGFDAKSAQQAQALAMFWRTADLGVEGDAESECALRFNLFHLFQAASRDGSGSVAAKGLTGEGYEGHIFWDAETFVLPALTLTAPDLARHMLDYRHRTLPAARAHAREMNHARGALYAWRTIGGEECSAHYPSGSAQYHINAAVAYAIELYAAASDDVAWLRARGAEILVETARVWLDVGHFNARRSGAFCIHAVTGPDEYTALVDNNFYTNCMAQRHLRFAAKTVRDWAAQAPAEYAAFEQALALDAAEVAAWQRAADAMYLPYDAALGIYAQDDTFLDKPRWDFAATPADKYPLLMHFHPLTIYRHQVCKQADAILALVLAGSDVDTACKRRCFDYYEPITVHDSTLSTSTFAILATEVGYPERALTYFHDCLRVDLDDLHGNTGHGAHMAAMAGSWLALAWGFGGLRVDGGSLAFAPQLPLPWQGYRFGLCWKHRRLSVHVTSGGATYELHDGSPLEIAHAGNTVLLQPGVAKTLPLAPPPSRRAFPRDIRAIIFDLDGVLADTAQLHHAAWRRLAQEIGVAFDETLGERLKGVDRARSLALVLGARASDFSAAQQDEFAERKNGYYRAAIATLGPADLLPGALQALDAARAAGLKIGLASASRSARDVAERLGIAAHFDYIADAAHIARAKPDPEIFAHVAAALGVAPAQCLGIEDAAAGVAAIKAAGMSALGIGDARVLGAADAVLADLTALDLNEFVRAPD